MELSFFRILRSQNTLDTSQDYSETIKSVSANGKHDKNKKKKIRKSEKFNKI